MSLAAKKSPLVRVKDEFGGKDKLVDKLVGVLDTGDEGKDDLRRRLLGVANSKLARLYGVATRSKEAGGHDKLVSAVAEKAKHGKDKDYVAKLDGYSDARLLDILGSGRNGRSAAGAATAAQKWAKKKAAPAKAEKSAKPAAKRS
jgi:hypothetical protein